MSLHLLEELARSGASLSIFGGTRYNSIREGWSICAEKDADGVKMEVRVLASDKKDLDAAIKEVHAKWVKATGGLPSHALPQLAFTPKVEEAEFSPMLGDAVPPPTSPDDEIPF